MWRHEFGRLNSNGIVGSEIEKKEGLHTSDKTFAIGVAAIVFN